MIIFTETSIPLHHWPLFLFCIVEKLCCIVIIMCASQLPQRYILPRIWKALCLPEKPIKFNHLKQFHNLMFQCSFITSKTASLLKLIALRGQSQKLNCSVGGNVFKTLTCSAPPLSTTFSSFPITPGTPPPSVTHVGNPHHPPVASHTPHPLHYTTFDAPANVTTLCSVEIPTHPGGDQVTLR